MIRLELPGVQALAGEVGLVSGECIDSTRNSIISGREQFRSGDQSKRIECNTRHPLDRELETTVLGEERGEDHVQEEVGRECEWRQVTGLVAATATFG